VPPLARRAEELAAAVTDPTGLEQLRETCYRRSRILDEAHSRARGFDFDAPAAAIANLVASFPDRYPSDTPVRFARARDALTTALAGFRSDDLAERARLEAALTREEREVLLNHGTEASRIALEHAIQERLGLACARPLPNDPWQA